MPKTHVEKSLTLNAPIDQVFSAINDLHHWGKWSPWLILEPEAEVTVAEDGKSYSWQGQRIGSGHMQISGESKNQWINFDLTFLTPWKSTANVRFEFHPKPDGQQTTVTWMMDSKLPFFMFWMKGMMETFIGMDFERGLKLLKDHVEDGHVHSTLEFQGVSAYPGCQYVGIKNACAIADIGDAMKRDFETLSTFCQSHQDTIAGPPVSIYHKWSLTKMQATYTAAIPVTQIPADLSASPATLITGHIPATQVYTIRHIGPYEHLANAWAAVMNLQRSKQVKTKKGIHPFEEYVNDPCNVTPNELITDIRFAVM